MILYADVFKYYSSSSSIHSDSVVGQFYVNLNTTLVQVRYFELVSNPYKLSYLNTTLVQHKSNISQILRQILDPNDQRSSFVTQFDKVLPVTIL